MNGSFGVIFRKTHVGAETERRMPIANIAGLKDGGEVDFVHRIGLVLEI